MSENVQVVPELPVKPSKLAGWKKGASIAVTVTLVAALAHAIYTGLKSGSTEETETTETAAA